MVLKLYNTLTRKKEVFKPIKKGFAEIYVCGPTIYNYAHIGNLRAYVFSDILRRYLEFSGYKIKEVMNLTDVEDKTIRGSQKAGESLRKFTEKYEKAFLEDLKSMNVEKPEIMPRATEHIKEMVAIIKKLLKEGIAYEAKDGIYFSIRKFKNYGKLSGVKIKELKAGASERVEKDEYDKESANDFALWKFYDKEDGDVFWETEIGKGRPGWHIECSAMSMKYLGETFDIHVGGVDLIFPHHENEIAQSEAFTGKKFVNYWLHNEWILVDGKKMSKSLGNFYTLRDLTEKDYSPTDLRYFYLSKNYRQQLNFTLENLDNSKNSLERLKNIILNLDKNQKKNKKNIDGAREQFIKIMDDDLNFTKALSFLWEILRDERLSDFEKYELALEFDKVLGLDLGKEEKIKIPDEVKRIVKEREDARKNQEWKKSDELREKIKKLGFAVDDTKEGYKIRKI
ncbi:MAG: cysteine--tRNA ligase [Candidatus Nanoarchaeia archaeon]|nr:cysteine--tRNA ligase [Candidatus Nanoarchaeia archaeon]MDD5357615.1 cysteine--tRNA ligase [Candidatus Nanoarchaeia archaeon]MDD5588534.1 cysteine--tRNA ligase [Candidatus Nanoarchaeia archaeon]